MDLMSRTLNKLDAFLKGKRVVTTKAWRDITDKEKKEIFSATPPKNNSYFTKRDRTIPKTFVRVQVKDISEI